nr:15-hydroxyprostaglandin dehydrogenase [Trichonephila clavipes]
MPDEIFFPLQLLQLEEAIPSTTPYRDHHRGGPLRLPGGRKDALHDSQKCTNELLSGKRMLYADGPTNLEQPTLNHVQRDTMASAVLADLTRALQGTNRGSGPAMEESENEVGSLEQILLYADDHYLARKLCPWETI